MDMREKALAIRAKRQELERLFPEGDCVCITLRSDVHNTVGGMLMELPVPNAAEGLFKGTHALATADQIRTFRAGQEDMRQRLQAHEAAKGTTYLIGQQIFSHTKGKR